MHVACVCTAIAPQALKYMLAPHIEASMAEEGREQALKDALRDPSAVNRHFADFKVRAAYTWCVAASVTYVCTGAEHICAL